MIDFEHLHGKDRFVYMLLDLFQRLCIDCVGNASGKGYQKLVHKIIDVHEMDYDSNEFENAIIDMRMTVKELTGHRYQISVLCEILKLLGRE